MTLNIVGGSYIERCAEGDWNQLFGSGMRAACAISDYGKVILHTYADNNNRKLVETTANTFAVDIQITNSKATPAFFYTHGLAVPQIHPALIATRLESPIRVDADKILRFGMVEGSAVVNGDMVVYDPQSAYGPDSFRNNGSTANRLAIVCNRFELSLLTREHDLQTAIGKLKAAESAEVVVVKCGSQGAYVSTPTSSGFVPAFKTSRIWPIGSGDVFAAAFFWYWTNGIDSFQAAENASRSTAYYCQDRALPLPILNKLASFQEVDQRTHRDRPPLVYLAGPFFTMSERWLVNETREALVSQGLNVFSPYHDVGLGTAAEVVPKDIQAIADCDCMFALLDNLDCGTIFEIGYAKSAGKQVYVFCQNVSLENLKMIEGTGCEIFDDFVTAVYQTAWNLSEK